MNLSDADWLTDSATQRIFALLDGYPSYAVGGCVRNSLLGVDVKDIDFATAARPDVVVQLAEAADLRAVPTGIDHGTVTVLVGHVPFEITTFRRDVETDGRRAVIAFADTLEEDARRRDFTINAIYADADGTLHDPVKGLPDVAERRIRFIEDAESRIREDYLRSLRFFRFSAWYGHPEAGMDPDALDAIARNLPGLETLSRERVGSELHRLLDAPDPAPAVAAMRATGVLTAILPGSDDHALAPLVALEQALDVAPCALRRFAVLGGEFETLRMSRADATRIETIRNGIGQPAGTLGYRHGSEVGRDTLLAEAAIMGRHIAPAELADVKKGAEVSFPVRSEDLMPGLQGKPLGDALRRLEDAWIESGFTLSRERLLSMR